MTDKPAAAKPRVEVAEESHERLEVLELKRLPREEKLAREQAFAEGASEVHYVERAFRPHHAGPVDDVRARVDALQPRRRELPAIPEAPTLPPEPAAPAAPAAPPVEERHRKALEKAVPGALVRAETVYATEAGEVVEATWRTKQGEATRAFLLRDGRATPVEDVAAQVDRLPAPTPPTRPEAPAPEPAPASDAKPEEPKKGEKKRFGLGRKKKENEEADAAPAPAPEAETPPPKEEAPAEGKRRFGFGKKKAAEAPAPAEDAPAPAPAKEAGEKKRRLPFGRKKEPEAELSEAEAAAEAASTAEAPEADAKPKKRFALRRK